MKSSLVAEFVRHDSPQEAARRGATTPLYTVAHDFGLERAGRASSGPAVVSVP